MQSGNFLKYVNSMQTMYKQSLKTENTLFANLQDKQSRRYCKTICKNLHRHFLMCRSQTLRSTTRSTNCWLLTSAAWSTRLLLWWPCGQGQSADSPCPSHMCISTCRHWFGPCAPRRPTYTPAWFTSMLVKVSYNIILNPLTTQLNVLTKPLPNHAVSCEFWQPTICHSSILNKGNSAPIIWHFSFWFCN